MAHLQISELIPAPRKEVFDYLTEPKNLIFLLDPVIHTEVLSGEVELRRGYEVHLNMTRFGLTQSVRLKIEDVLRGSRLSYRQSEGLFSNWMHTMKFDEHGERATLVTDIVDYQLPFGFLGFLTDDLLIKGDMSRLLGGRLQKAKEYFQTNESAESEISLN